MKHTNKSVEGFTVVELLLVMTLLGVLAAVVLPRLARAKGCSYRGSCSNNLRQVGLSFKTWALDNEDKLPMAQWATNGGTFERVGEGFVYPHFQAMSNELSTPKILACPQDSTRRAATNFTSDLRDDKISYFIGVDATEQTPGRVLAGDRNLCINKVGVTGLVRLSTNAVVSWSSKLHGHQGYLLLADGSVHIVPDAWLRASFPEAHATNRLMIPR